MTSDPSFSKYDVDAAWPSLIDEFVEYGKEKIASGEGIKANSKMEE